MTYEKWQSPIGSNGSYVVKTRGVKPLMGLANAQDVYMECLPCDYSEQGGFSSPLCNCVTDAVDNYPLSHYYGSKLLDPLIPDILGDHIGIHGVPLFGPNSNTFVQDVIDKCEGAFITPDGERKIPLLPWNSHGSGLLGLPI